MVTYRQIALSVCLLGIGFGLLAAEPASQPTSSPATSRPASQPATQRVADSAAIVAEAFERIHKRVAALKAEHPVLEGIADARPRFGRLLGSDVLTASWNFVNNATDFRKMGDPAAIDSSKPYCQITLTMWTSAGSQKDTQPPACTRKYHIGGVDWDGFLMMWSDDAKLVEAVKTIVAEELARATGQPCTASGPASQPATQPVDAKVVAQLVSRLTPTFLEFPAVHLSGLSRGMTTSSAEWNSFFSSALQAFRLAQLALFTHLICFSDAQPRSVA